MNGPILREQIFHLLFQLDQTSHPDEIIQIQFKIESKYEELSCLTGASPAALERAILDQYPEWMMKHIRDLKSGGDTDADSN
jgi:hypothetical protein